MISGFTLRLPYVTYIFLFSGCCNDYRKIDVLSYQQEKHQELGRPLWNLFYEILEVS
jgi:hypothetical protein